MFFLRSRDIFKVLLNQPTSLLSRQVLQKTLEITADGREPIEKCLKSEKLLLKNSKLVQLIPLKNKKRYEIPLWDEKRKNACGEREKY